MATSAEKKVLVISENRRFIARLINLLDDVPFVVSHYLNVLEFTNRKGANSLAEYGTVLVDWDVFRGEDFLKISEMVPHVTLLFFGSDINHGVEGFLVKLLVDETEPYVSTDVVSDNSELIDNVILVENLVKFLASLTKMEGEHDTQQFVVPPTPHDTTPLLTDQDDKHEKKDKFPDQERLDQVGRIINKLIKKYEAHGFANREEATMFISLFLQSSGLHQLISEIEMPGTINVYDQTDDKLIGSVEVIGKRKTSAHIHELMDQITKIMVHSLPRIRRKRIKANKQFSLDFSPKPVAEAEEAWI